MPISLSCSYTSSGGAFPDGYSLWQHGEEGERPTLIACYCGEGYYPLDPGPAGPGEDGKIVKSPCVADPDPKAPTQQTS